MKNGFAGDADIGVDKTYSTFETLNIKRYYLSKERIRR